MYFVILGEYEQWQTACILKHNVTELLDELFIAGLVKTFGGYSIILVLLFYWFDHACFHCYATIDL